MMLADRILAVMIERNVRDCYNTDLQNMTGIENGYDLNDALERLEDLGAIEIKWAPGPSDGPLFGHITFKGKGKSIHYSNLNRTVRSEVPSPVIHQSFFGSVGNVVTGSQGFEQHATIQPESATCEQGRMVSLESPKMNKPSWRERIGQVARQHVSLLKKDGITTRHGIWAYIVRDPDEIIITWKDIQMPIEVGDTILRSSPAGQERLTITDHGHHVPFNPEMENGYPEHYAIRYVREEEAKTPPSTETLKDVDIAIAKLNGLQKSINSILGKAAVPYFEPSRVNEYFERYAVIRDELKVQLPSLYSDIPSREMPTIKPPTAYAANGYIDYDDFAQLARDIENILEIHSYAHNPKPVLEDKKMGHANQPATNSGATLIIHGHDESNRLRLKNFLAHKLGLPEPIIMSEQTTPGATLPEKFERLAQNVNFAIALLTPDDEGKAKSASDLKPRCRQNVIVEIGWFWGKLGRDHVLLLVKDEVEMPSDFQGLEYYPFHNSVDEVSEKIRDFYKAHSVETK